MPASQRQKRGQRAAARHMRALLLRQGTYRLRWEAHAHDITPGVINQSAVCQVVAQHLWDTGERSEADLQLPRKLKDRISRALSDQDMSLETLRWLVEGFELSAYDAQRVHELDTRQVDIRVRRGGTPSAIYPMGTHYAVDIVFPHPLRYGEEHFLDYWTLFRYSAPPPAEFRRAMHQRVEHLDMRVEFDRRKQPRRLWWAQWRDYRDGHADFVERETMELDEELSARKYLDAVERAVVGFAWEW